MSTKLTESFSSCEMDNTETYNELQIERIRHSRYGPSAAPAVAATSEALRVLVVDSHYGGARVLEILISMWGRDCRIAFDGASGLALALGFRPHVVLVDAVMPSMSGAELTVKLRQESRLKGSLIVALSGCTDTAYRLECERAGVDQYFIKPMSSAILKTLLALEAEYITRQCTALGSLSKTSSRSRLKRRSWESGTRATRCFTFDPHTLMSRGNAYVSFDTEKSRSGGSRWGRLQGAST